MPTAYTRTRVRRKPVPRETRVPTAMPALDRTRLERWVAAGARGPGVPGARRRAGRPAGPAAGATGRPGRCPGVLALRAAWPASA